MSQLELFQQSSKILVKRTCLIDSTHKTYINKKYGTERWFRYKDGWICLKCHHRLIGNPKRTKEYIKKYNDKRPKDFWKKYKTSPQKMKEYNSNRMNFINKVIRVSKSLLKDKCEWCSKKVGDEYVNCKGKIAKIDRIDTHHIEYYIIFPWFATIRLCSSCHMKETRRLEKIK